MCPRRETRRAPWIHPTRWRSVSSGDEVPRVGAGGWWGAATDVPRIKGSAHVRSVAGCKKSKDSSGSVCKSTPGEGPRRGDAHWYVGIRADASWTIGSVTHQTLTTLASALSRWAHSQ
jgi:hypothetical protein